MDQPPNQPFDPIGSLLSALQTAMRSAGSSARPAAQLDPLAPMRQWLAAMSGPWGAATTPPAMADLWARWLGQPEVSAALIDAWTRWYAANSAALAAALDEVLRAPDFVRASARALDDYATAVATQRRAGEMAARGLPFATHADIARLAQMVISVEAKIERLLDQEQPAVKQPAQTETVAAADALAARLERLEAKIDRLAAVLESGAPLGEAAVSRRKAATTARKTPAAATSVRGAGSRRAPESSQPRVRLVRGAKAR